MRTMKRLIFAATLLGVTGLASAPQQAQADSAYLRNIFCNPDGTYRCDGDCSYSECKQLFCCATCGDA